MNVGSALLWGFLATAVLTTLEAAGRGVGITRMSIPFMLGTIFTTNRSHAAVIGVMAHFVAGWLVALLYAATFENLGDATWWQGAIMGLAHAWFVLIVVLPLLPNIHPHMANDLQGPAPTPLLEPPGFMALNYGRRTAIVTMVSHIAYGFILGAGYVPEAV